MERKILYIACFFMLLLAVPQAADSQQSEVDEPPEKCAILLHGLMRSPSSMKHIQRALDEAGYEVVNNGYPSTDHDIAELANTYIPKAIFQCELAGADQIHFVTHSMGGILVRQYASEHDVDGLGRVVMLSPPNQGSELVDELADSFVFRLINGPAGMQLGTDSLSVPNRLGPVDFEVGVITGSESTNPIYSRIIPGADDGKVSVDRSRVDGMKDFLILPYGHTFIMRKERVIDEILHFLESGRFTESHLDREASALN